MISKNLRSYVLVFFICIFYFLVAYGLERTHFGLLTTLYFGLFSLSFLLYQNKKENSSFLVGIAFLFRLVFLFAIPNLSQDFYRFIWDGRMILEGFNPYLSLPESFIHQHSFPIAQAQELYAGMGTLNGSHYTNYPPINQLNFFIAAIVSKYSILGAIVALRLQIILADFGIFYFGKKVLEKLHLPISNIFFFLLNPFIIIELTGNLHFESVMLFFLVWSLYLLLQGKWVWAAIALGCSVSVKLIPLLLVPVFFQWFVQSQRVASTLIDTKESKKKWIPTFSVLSNFLVFGTLVILTATLSFLPFLSLDLVKNYSSSVGLWFDNFEFNASLYYIAREVGYLFRGYNEIAVIGKVMSALAVVIILGIAFFRNNKTPQKFFEALLLALTFYYFTTTTMHPWYLASLVLLGVFTKYRFAWVWSLLIVLTYHTYANNPWKENLGWVALEYLGVYGVLIWELTRKRAAKRLALS